MRLQKAPSQTLLLASQPVQWIHLTPVRDRQERIHTFKEFEMKKQLIWVLSAVLLSGVSVAAVASGHGMRDGNKGADVQLAKMELALKLEDAQRPAWNAFAKDIKDLAQAQEKQRTEQRKAMTDNKAMGATERMDAKEKMMQAKQTQLAQMKQATQTLTAQLSPAQQTVFNAEWSDTFGHGGRKAHGRSSKKGQREGCKG